MLCVQRATFSYIHWHRIKFETILDYHESRSSVVGIAAGYGLDDRGVGVRVPEWSRSLTSPYRPDQPPIQWVLSPREVKKTWIYTSTNTCLHGVVLS
jgi:hypothetical protein